MPVIYIPGLSDIVFLHTALTWHWPIVIIATILFFAGAEVYKWTKRVWLRRQEKRAAPRTALDQADAEKAEAQGA